MKLKPFPKTEKYLEYKEYRKAVKNAKKISFEFMNIIDIILFNY
jgi:hypothetical protein